MIANPKLASLAPRVTKIRKVDVFKLLQVEGQIIAKRRKRVINSRAIRAVSR